MKLDLFLRYLREREVIKHIPENSLVCDIGCGRDAHFLKKITGLIRRGFGFDIELDYYKDSKIELNKINLDKGILPISKQTIDVVVMLAVVEHLRNPKPILKNIFQILKPGGYLILTTPTPKAKVILEFLAFKLRVIGKKDIKEHRNYLSEKDINKLLLASGFESKNIAVEYFELGLNTLVIAKK